MDRTHDIPDYLREQFPEARDALLCLFARAAESRNLLQTDFLTIRDLLDLSGCAKSETLHVLLVCMFLALEEGSLCVEVSAPALERRLSDLTGEAEAKAWATAVVTDVQSGFPELIGTEVHHSRPVILVSSGARRFAYFQKYLVHEMIFRDAVARRLSATSSGPDPRKLSTIVEDVLQRHPLRIDGRPLILDRRQRQALELALGHDFAVVSGGPGTGKTSIVLTLLRCLVRVGYNPDRIALAAPTGRAAQRLTDALLAGLAGLKESDQLQEDEALGRLVSQTIHRLLEYNPTRGTFGRHAENPIPADVIVVDEVSMVGVELISKLLQSTADGSKLVLLGDKDQLPSVDAGAVLASLVPADGAASHFKEEAEGVDFVVVLEENYRSELRIRAVAGAINERDIGIVERLPVVPLVLGTDNGTNAHLDRLQQEGGCWFWPQEADHGHALRQVIETWVRQQYLTPMGDLPAYGELVRNGAGMSFTEDVSSEQASQLNRIFQAVNRARLLTVVRDGRWGCVDINRFMEELLRPKWDRASREGIFAGAPILITRNDYARQLFNGDVGVTLRSPHGGHRVVFPRQGGYISVPADSLPPHELGFAVTVHKSQGSEYEQVLLVLPPQAGRRLLTKEIVYTAVTRAKRLAIICATEESLKFAIGRGIERETGLNPRREQQSPAT